MAQTMRIGRGTRASIVLAALALLGVTSTARIAQADATIQPGAVVSINGQCTLNFVFTSGADRYIGTAGHCASEVGLRARASDGEFGTVVFRQNDGQLDFALIRVDEGRTVDPAVRHWGGPTGVTDDAETAAGDTLLVSGYGIVFATTAYTRPRPGVLTEDDDTSYVADSLAVNGDSGGPLLHERTGKALGIISRYAFEKIPPATDEGPTVEHILRKLADAGFALTLATAPYTGLG